MGNENFLNAKQDNYFSELSYVKPMDKMIWVLGADFQGNKFTPQSFGQFQIQKFENNSFGSVSYTHLDVYKRQAHNSLCTNHIYEFGNEVQRHKWLPKLASGKVIGAWGLTEHNTGSDSGGMSTTAVKDGDDWVLNGAKNFITHAISGDIAVVMTRTGEKGARNNSTAFVLSLIHI